MILLLIAVDGRNPASVDLENIQNMILRFHTSLVLIAGLDRQINLMICGFFLTARLIHQLM